MSKEERIKEIEEYRESIATQLENEAKDFHTPLNYEKDCVDEDQTEEEWLEDELDSAKNASYNLHNFLSHEDGLL